MEDIIIYVTINSVTHPQPYSISPDILIPLLGASGGFFGVLIGKALVVLLGLTGGAAILLEAAAAAIGAFIGWLISQLGLIPLLGAIISSAVLVIIIVYAKKKQKESERND